MKVQRAPRSSAQPQPAPADFVDRRPHGATPARESLRLFSAGVDLDLTDRLRRLDDVAIAAEVIADLVFACRHEGVGGASTSVRLLRPTAHGLVGVVLPSGSDQSVGAVAAALSTLTSELPELTDDMLTVVHIGATRARPPRPQSPVPPQKPRPSAWGSGSWRTSTSRSPMLAVTPTGPCVLWTS